MNVRAIVEVLGQYPEDMRIVVNGFEEGYDDLSPEFLSVVELALNANRYRFVGRHAVRDELTDKAQTNARIATALALHRPRHLDE